MKKIILITLVALGVCGCMVDKDESCDLEIISEFVKKDTTCTARMYEHGDFTYYINEKNEVIHIQENYGFYVAWGVVMAFLIGFFTGISKN